MLSRLIDGEHDTLEIFHHIIVGESEHTVSAGSKPFIAPAVVTETRFEIVALAVDLNNNLNGMRDEVRNVITHRTLPPKSESSKSMCFQVTPQQSFGTRHRAP